MALEGVIFFAHRLDSKLLLLVHIVTKVLCWNECNFEITRRVSSSIYLIINGVHDALRNNMAGNGHQSSNMFKCTKKLALLKGNKITIIGNVRSMLVLTDK